MPSPNAYYFDYQFVLVPSIANLNDLAGYSTVLIESRRTKEGIYFHFISNHTLDSAISFSVLATPNHPPREQIETSIV